MKKRWLSLLACALLLTGCSRGAAESTAETLPPMTEAPDPVLIYYVNDHGTTDIGQLSSFSERLRNTGYTLQADSFQELPMNANAVIVNSPAADLTADEVTLLDQYMDTGGHLLFLMPADESTTRYKYWERFLEEYCILMDYDRVTETEDLYMWESDPAFPYIEQVSAPEQMVVLPGTAATSLFMHNARSFHFVVLDNYTNIRQDGILESKASAVGVPCGGTADDPVQYEGEQLMTMLYSRDTSRKESFVVCVGASDFLLDANYSAKSSSSAQDYVYAALDWAVSRS